MAFALADRVQETTTTTGTGSVTLGGAVTGYQTFAVIGNGNTTFYCIADQGGANWEVGVGTYSTTGPTLARTTVLASSNAGSLVSFTAGIKTVFVTYPSEKSVNLDASGNVSALGNITSAVWNGTTVGVAYGGTGVTASSGANSVVLRDANVNISANNIAVGWTNVTSAAGTTTLTAASTHFQRLTGTANQTFKLPDATTLTDGISYLFDNDSTGVLTIVDDASGTVDTVAAGGYSFVFLESNAIAAGEWGRAGMIPAEVNWGTNSLDMGGSTIVTGGTWQGTTVATGYGGTGLTSFTSGGALYATSTSALTSGTLPPSAGGTGATGTPTNGQLLIGNGTNYTVASLTAGTGISITPGSGSLTITNSSPLVYPSAGLAYSTGSGWGTSYTTTGTGTVVALQTSPSFVTPILGTPTSGTLSNCTGLPLTTGVTGVLPIANGGTNTNTSPVNGGIAYGTGSAYSFTSAGTSGQILQSNGTSTPTWVTPSYATNDQAYFLATMMG